MAEERKGRVTQAQARDALDKVLNRDTTVWGRVLEANDTVRLFIDQQSEDDKPRVPRWLKSFEKGRMEDIDEKEWFYIDGHWTRDKHNGIDYLVNWLESVYYVIPPVVVSLMEFERNVAAETARDAIQKTVRKALDVLGL